MSPFFLASTTNQLLSILSGYRQIAYNRFDRSVRFFVTVWKFPIGGSTLGRQRDLGNVELG